VASCFLKIMQYLTKYVFLLVMLLTSHIISQQLHITADLYVYELRRLF